VEQWRGQSGDRIGGEDSDTFALVAAVTAKRQIGGYGQPAEDERDDVINCERIGRVASLRATVFAAVIRAFDDQASQFGWDIFSDIVGEVNVELIHQRGQANAAQPGELDHCGQAFGVEFFGLQSQASQLFVFGVGDCFAFAFGSQG
jgi:hypothetical protein